MKIVFRVDASVRMGTGHFVRCLTLAEALRERGAQICFVCREHAGNLIALLQQRAMPVKALPAPTINDTASNECYAAWLGVTQAEDAEQTIDALNSAKPDWLVVDHYGLDIEWEQRLRPHTEKLLVIDDLANRRHDCDVLLDQNYSTGGELRYGNLTPDACSRLVGPCYALLQPEYALHRKTMRAHDGIVNRVMVYFGGTDSQNMTGLALRALSHPALEQLKVDVIVGVNNPHRKNIEEQVFRRPNTNLHEPQSHLVGFMEQADLALGAGGMTTWERMCLGLPTVLVTVAKNQCYAAEALAEKNLISYVGSASEVSSESIARAVIELASNSAQLVDMSTKSQLMVDGLGCARISEIMMPTEAEKLQLRSAHQEDALSYFNWVNDPEVRKQSFQTDPIPWLVHKEWFAKKLNDPNSHLYVLNAGRLPVGQIRFDKENHEARIDYSLDALVRGRGWGVRLVSLGAELFKRTENIRLLAEVKAGNEASQSILLRLGFVMSKKGENNNNCMVLRLNAEKNTRITSRSIAIDGSDH